MPHLSLLYSSDPRAKEEGLAEASSALAEAFREEEEEEEEGQAGDNGGGRYGDVTKKAAGLSWLSSEIEVWLTEGEVEDWRCEARVPLGKT